MMKKTLITLIAFVAMATTMTAFGQIDTVNHYDPNRYLATTFQQNWFISADGSINWWKGSDKNPMGNYTAVQWGKPSFGASLNLGKWITHSFGVRLSYDVNGGKSYIDGLHVNRRLINFLFDGNFTYDEDYANNGIYTYIPGKNDFPSEDGADENGYYNTSFMYHNLHLDVFLSPIDLIQGYYNPYRVYTPHIYIGMGAAAVSEGILITPDLIYNSKNKGNPDKEKGVNFELAASAGLINNFRLSNHLDLHLDLKWSAQRWNIDSWFYEPGGQQGGWYYADGTAATGNVPNEAGENPTYYNRHRIDQNFSIGMGLCYYFSRIYELPMNCTKEMEEFKKKLALCEEEMANLPVVGDVPCDTIEKIVYVQDEDIISYPFSIFFNLDSYQLMSRRDLVNLREIAEVAKANGYKLRLRGSCDSATATAAYNQTLSENRCRKIMMELMEMGIPESQIILVPVGGVNELDPTEFDRRVLIDLIKEAPKK
jgi:hypothetical protein